MHYQSNVCCWPPLQRMAILMPIWNHIILDAVKCRIATPLSVPNWNTLTSTIPLDNLVSHIQHGLDALPHLPLHLLDHDTIEYVYTNNNLYQVAGNKVAWHIMKRSEVHEAICSSFLSNTSRKHLEALYLFMFNKSVLDDQDNSLIYSWTWTMS